MMNDFDPSVELAIELASHDIAKSMSDRYGADFSRVKRNVGAMVRAACAGSKNEAGWIRNPEFYPWFCSAAAGAINREVLASVLPGWWDSLDPQSHLNVIMGPAGHHKSEYINAIVQKYQDKPDTELQKDLPDLYKAYSAAAGQNAPAPAASSLKKMAGGGDARYDTNAWVQAWIEAEDLESDPRIVELKAMNAPVEQKVLKAKEISKEMAYAKVAEAARAGGIEIEFDTLGLDARNDRMNWEALVSVEKEEDEE